MIDPINSLAFSMQANKGIYAILLGSGVSRAAQIPTGWEITLDLIRKLADLEGDNCEPAPEDWFIKTKGKSPSYSELLNAVAKTPAERQQLLRTYWEPTEQEREEGVKAPTKAHRAVADLVKQGYIKVILTTNFDRLLEIALQDVGIQATILSTPDNIVGALPLVHTACTVVKIHGDYMDTRIKNTPEELEEYPEIFNNLLDRIFDEYGLIIAGWSADWDDALRAAITRTPSRRFATYWASKGSPSTVATDLITRRGATLIEISDADSFFESVNLKVKGLEEFSQPHPLSTAAAVATIKRYLSEPKYRIQLDDLVSRETENVFNVTREKPFNMTAPIDGENILTRLQSYERPCHTLLLMAFHAGQWSEDAQIKPWINALTKLVNKPHHQGFSLWLNLQRYPSLLLLFAFGLGAVEKERWGLLNSIFNSVIVRENREDKCVVQILPPWILLVHEMNSIKLLPGRKDQYTPLQNHLEVFLGQLLGQHFTSADAFQITFDKFEVLTALSFACNIPEDKHYWTVLGAYGWRNDNRQRIISEIRTSLQTLDDNSPFVSSGIVGKTATNGLGNLTRFESFIAKLNWW